MAKLKIEPIGKEIEVNEGQSVLAALKEHSVAIKNSCGGCASCSHCIVVIGEGEEYANEISFEEKQVLGNTYHITKERLSCQLYIKDDLTIDISNHGYEAKVKAKPLLRKKAQVEQIREERIEKRKEAPKKLGGSRRPKAFNFDPDDIFVKDPTYTKDKGE